MPAENYPRFFYGWIIVAVATLALVVSNGLAVGGIPVFYEWIRNDLIASGEISAGRAQSVVANFGVLTFLVAGFSAPLAGWLIQKFALRSLMLAGCAILGGALILHAQAARVETIYFARILMGLSLGFVGVLSSTVLVSNWFVRRRGLALGIVLTGTSFGGVLIPLVAAPLVAAYGWRTAMLFVSLLVWLVLVPAVIFLVKQKPSDIGLAPDGDPAEMQETTGEFNAETAENRKPKTQPGLSLSEALKTPIFWIFALCAMLVFYPLFVTTQQFILYLRTEKIGYSPAAAASMISLMSGLSIGGKFIFGYLSDKLAPVRVMLLCCAVMFLGTLALLGFSAGLVLVFLIPFGLGYGGTFVLLQRLIADFFGTRDYAKILGVITVIETVGAAIGGRITGAIADLDGGDYTRAFYGVAVTTGAALVCVVMLNFMHRDKAYLTK